MKVYLFLYNPDTPQDDSRPISIHKSKEGADTARDIHEENIRTKFLYDPPFSYDFLKSWSVKEMELED